MAESPSPSSPQSQSSPQSPFSSVRYSQRFDERHLEFVFQEHRSDGRESNFFRLDNPDREDG